jgi:serine/threonine protein kinase
MAPEAVKGSPHYEPCSDIYSLGCTAYCMLAGRPPFDGTTAPEIIAAHILRDPVPIDGASEFEIPETLAHSVMRCMRKDPGERFDDVRELKARLESIEFPEPWTARTARAWWDLHLPEEVLEIPPATLERSPFAP